MNMSQWRKKREEIFTCATIAIAYNYHEAIISFPRFRPSFPYRSSLFIRKLNHTNSFFVPLLNVKSNKSVQ